MLEVLVASRPRDQRRPAAFLVAASVHATFLGLGIVTTGVAVQQVSRAADETSLILLPALEQPVVQQAHPTGGGNGGSSVAVVASNPPPRGFQVVDLVSSVPTSLPPPDAGLKPLDPRDFTGRGVEGGTGWGVAGGTGSADQPIPGEGESNAVYDAGMENARFSPAEMRNQPRFIYPKVQLEAGIEGQVVIQFIVDTLGQVEPASIEVLSSNLEVFSTAASEGILSARFAPAHYGGSPVRQRTRMPVSFTIRPNRATG
jgi:protein TonB